MHGRLQLCSRLAGRRIVFQPYSKEQLTTIITSRLGEARLPRQLWCWALASPALPTGSRSTTHGSYG